MMKNAHVESPVAAVDLESCVLLPERLQSSLPRIVSRAMIPPRDESEPDSEFKVCHAGCMSKRLILTIILFFVVFASFAVIFTMPASCNANSAFGLITAITGAMIAVVTRKRNG